MKKFLRNLTIFFARYHAKRNPLYQIIFGGTGTKEQCIVRCEDYLTAGLADGTATVKQLNRRRRNLAQLNAVIQMLRSPRIGKVT